MTTNDEAARLAGALTDAARAAGVPATGVEALKRLSGGASKQSWMFDLLTDTGRQSLVARLEPPESRFDDIGTVDVRGEAILLRVAHAGGVRVPEVAFELRPEDGVGEGYAMARVEGESVGVRILRDPALAEIRPHLAFQCGEQLARIHALSPAALPMLPAITPRMALAQLEERYRASGQVRPVFEYAFAWLRANMPDDAPATVVHGDFRNGNLMIGADGLRAVLDWELAHVGDPASDLGWLCVTSWRFQRPDLPVGGFGTREQLAEGYRAAGGAPIDPARIALWEIFQTLNWGVMCAGVGARFAQGVRTVEGALIARRASETEFDLMRLLAPEVADAG